MNSCSSRRPSQTCGAVQQQTDVLQQRVEAVPAEIEGGRAVVTGQRGTADARGQVRQQNIIIILSYDINILSSKLFLISNIR